MPTETHALPRRLRLATVAAAAALSPWALAQTDDAAPFYAGGSIGATRVSNLFRQADGSSDDTVTSLGLLAGLDQRLGRQHLTLDGNLQDNRYATNRELNNRSYSLRSALNWQTVEHLSGVLSGKSTRSLADFNIGSGVSPVLILKKNVERNDEYQALARLGLASRTMIEGSWTYRQREFSAEEYNRFVFRQDTASLGAYATPAGNLKLGLVGRHTKGKNPRYPVGGAVTALNEYTRDDIDFTTRWNTGGSSVLNTRISRSKTSNSLDELRDFTGTTGAVGWNWQPTGKLQFNAQYARDTGQETFVTAADLNRVFTSWQLGGSYALTAKLNLSARASNNRARRSSDSVAVVSDALDDTKVYNLSLRWTFSQALSLTCQVDRSSRNSSVPQYIYSASSFGCTGQALLF
ncbi:hypothetical protein DBR42_28055 [Pelomonas sp. HMWF004]|nr:hypothetical protein DBR42_28055 [Pelomonas sp. HMWF004]